MSRLFVDDFRDAIWASDLPPSARLLLLAMAEHCTYKNGKDCRPGVTRLMAETGLSKSTILRLWDELTEDAETAKPGWLRLVKKGASKPKRVASVYRLIIPTGVVMTPVHGDTGSTMNRTGVMVNHDWCHGDTPPPMTTVDHRADEIAEEHKVAAAQGLRAYREAVGREAS